MRTCTVTHFFSPERLQTAQWLWSRHVKRKLCRRIQSSSTSNSTCLGKLCLKLARKQSFPSTKNGVADVAVAPTARLKIWPLKASSTGLAAKAEMWKRRMGLERWMVGYTHTINESTMLSNNFKWKYQKKHHFFLLTPFQRLQKDTQSLQWGLVYQLRLLIIHTSLWDLQAGWLCLSGIGLCQCYQIARIQRQWISVLLKTRKNTIRTMYVTLFSVDDMGGYATKDQRINKELLPHAPFALNW